MLGQIKYFLRIKGKDWLKPDALRRLELRRLRRIVTRSYHDVPFYRDLWNRHGIHTVAIDSPEDLNRFPIIDKKMIKQAGREMLSRNYDPDRLISEKTSGSTGEPLVIYRDPDFEHLIAASKLRSYMANGFSLFDRTVEWKAKVPPQKAFHRLGIHREYTINRNTPLDEQVSILRGLNPEIYNTNASQLIELAQYLIKEGLPPFRPKRIFTNSENLFPDSRAFIREQYGAEPLDTYALRELGYVAWECEAREGYHVNADLMMLQILDPRSGKEAGEGESGHVVITSFFNEAFPLIRYDTQDIAVNTTKKCSCGRGFPLIRNIEGRDYDFLYLPSGKRVSGPVMATLALREFLEIERFQVVLAEEDRLLVRLKLEEGKVIDEAEIRKAVHARFGEMRVTIQIVDGFENGNRRKFRVFVNQLRNGS